MITNSQERVLLRHVYVPTCGTTQFFPKFHAYDILASSSCKFGPLDFALGFGGLNEAEN
jgi:hypothetical protein